MPQRYEKVITSNSPGALCAIYEPHPFRNSVIKEAVEQSGKIYSSDTGVDDDSWCWVYYDWVGNPVAVSSKQPNGDIVDKIPDSLNGKEYAEYLNKEPIK